MANSPSQEMITIQRKELLSFFDEKPEWSITHATSIVAIVGEDLNAACFAHYLEAKGATSRVLESTVGTGGRKGPRLDRWIDVLWSDQSRTVFQTEIKNYSAHAFGGERLPLPASSSQIVEYKQRRWDRHWNKENHTLRAAYTGKVLVPMKPPKGVDQKIIQPLLIFWEAMGPKESPREHLFSVSNPNHSFPGRSESWPTSPQFAKLWVFSVSSYLRSVEDDVLELPMPNAAHRLRILNELFKSGG